MNVATTENVQENRGRVMKVSPEEVYEYLSDGIWHVTADIAEAFECDPKTIRKRVKSLLDDGFLILKGSQGVRLVDETSVDEATVEEIGAMMHWLFKSVTAMTHHATPVKKFLPQIRKALPKTAAERHYLRQLTVRITHLIDWDSIEDMDDA